MPKPRTITHSGTAQVFKGRPVPPKKMEQLILESGEIITLENTPKVVKEDE
jgi:hypothetical protein